MKNTLLIIAKILGIYLITAVAIFLSERYVLFGVLSSAIFHILLVFLFVSEKLMLSDKDISRITYVKERLKINHGILIGKRDYFFHLTVIDKEVEGLNLKEWYKSSNYSFDSAILVKKINWWLFWAIFFLACLHLEVFSLVLKAKRCHCLL